jgi:hypothetical protein
MNEEIEIFKRKPFFCKFKLKLFDVAEHGHTTKRPVIGMFWSLDPQGCDEVEIGSVWFLVDRTLLGKLRIFLLNT